MLSRAEAGGSQLPDQLGQMKIFKRAPRSVFTESQDTGIQMTWALTLCEEHIKNVSSRLHRGVFRTCSPPVSAQAQVCLVSLSTNNCTSSFSTVSCDLMSVMVTAWGTLGDTEVVKWSQCLVLNHSHVVSSSHLSKL